MLFIVYIDYVVDIFSLDFKRPSSDPHLVALLKSFAECLQEGNLFQVENATLELVLLTYPLYLSQNTPQEHL